MKALPNIHPGEVLLEEFLTPFGNSQNALARARCHRAASMKSCWASAA
jgi:plasmid maintenance system antidote protein VapI